MSKKHFHAFIIVGSWECLQPWGLVDTIISNPPYIFHEDMSDLAAEILWYTNFSSFSTLYIIFFFAAVLKLKAVMLKALALLQSLPIIKEIIATAISPKSEFRYVFLSSDNIIFCVGGKIGYI